MEGEISRHVFAVPGVKGISFGRGFDCVTMSGSEFNDEFYMDGDTVRTRTNHSGGINGGITNGMPILFTTAVKPTPSIFKEQQSVDPHTMTPYTLSLKGRHDPSIVHRIRAVVDAMTAIVLSDLLLTQYGRDYFYQNEVLP